MPRKRKSQGGSKPRTPRSTNTRKASKLTFGFNTSKVPAKRKKRSGFFK